MEPYPTYEDGLPSEYLPPDYIDPLYIPTPEYLPSDEYPATASYDIPMDYGHLEDYQPPLQPVYKFVPQRYEDRDALNDINIDDHWIDPDIDDEDDVWSEESWIPYSSRAVPNFRDSTVSPASQSGNQQAIIAP